MLAAGMETVTTPCQVIKQRDEEGLRRGEEDRFQAGGNTVNDGDNNFRLDSPFYSPLGP